MKKCTILLALIVICSSIYAQRTEETTEYSNAGKILIETGYNSIFAFGINSGSGVTTIFDEGESATTLGLTLGKMLSNDLAILGSVSFLKSGSFDVSGVGLGVKYYAGSVVPLKFMVSYLNLGNPFGGSDSDGVILGNLGGGYAIPLAENIYLEPSVGIVANLEEISEDGATFFVFGVAFSLFL